LCCPLAVLVALPLASTSSNKPLADETYEHCH
jgi:hypothetical protein